MKILMHTCCGPCSIYPLHVLRTSGHDVTGFFYNHNIHPAQEYLRRLEAVKQMAEHEKLHMIIKDDYDLEAFLTSVAAKPSERCSYCYSSRLRMAAAAAVEHGFEAFTSSLLYSRYQRHDEIRRLGEQIAQEYGIVFFYQDFRPGWQEGIRLSKEIQLYRQQYCGCVYSEKERYYSTPKAPKL
ncbi:epoxyqueuosine reductase QueH [Pelotalea chapellei]|uniref:Epoxyqueuosine reductase QueH n=1 Tax=Pelotalea chapellei TaxID=44671 RepID=A0ABS5U7Z6_9BACT|nr:epoxyqueuosine reductase QueH [Pelotalea chapellei]MBT1071787.1 epoxyqueuosine reductase QueH [Pelotalea chapellei]